MGAENIKRQGYLFKKQE